MRASFSVADCWFREDVSAIGLIAGGVLILDSRIVLRYGKYTRVGEIIEYWKTVDHGTQWERKCRGEDGNRNVVLRRIIMGGVIRMPGYEPQNLIPTWTSSYEGPIGTGNKAKRTNEKSPF